MALNLMRLCFHTQAIFAGDAQSERANSLPDIISDTVQIDIYEIDILNNLSKTIKIQI